MHTSVFLSAVLCSLVGCQLFADVSGLGDEPPYMDTLREVIYETNQYLIEKNLAVVEIPKTEFGNFFGKVNIVGGTVGNFATAQLVGDAYLNETDLADKTAYYFSIGVGLTDVKINLDYKAKFLGIISSSATINIVNTGNTAVAVGAVYSSGSATQHKCVVELESITVKDVGNIALTFEPSGVFHWIMEKFSNVFLRLAAPFARNVIQSTVKQISEKQQVKDILTTIMCRYF